MVIEAVNEFAAATTSSHAVPDVGNASNSGGDSNTPNEATAARGAATVVVGASVVVVVVADAIEVTVVVVGVVVVGAVVVAGAVVVGGAAVVLVVVVGRGRLGPDASGLRQCDAASAGSPTTIAFTPDRTCSVPPSTQLELSGPAVIATPRMTSATLRRAGIRRRR